VIAVAIMIVIVTRWAQPAVTMASKITAHK
jgi:hypothetical protein